MWPFKKKNTPVNRTGLVFSGTSFGIETLPDKAPEGTPYRWMGEKWTDTYVRDAEGNLKPFKLRDFIAPDSILPDKQYRALKWKSCVQPLFRLSQSWLDKVNQWMGVALIGILLVALFVLYSALTGD